MEVVEAIMQLRFEKREKSNWAWEVIVEDTTSTRNKEIS